MKATLKGHRALVTGASGFIGAHLCSALVAHGCEVHGASRGAVESTRRRRGVSFHSCDLTDGAAVRDLVREVRPDFVFHLASHVMGAPDIAHVLPTFHANLHSTVNLLSACVEVACRRVVLMGSLVEPDEGSTERVPTSPYAAAKWASANYGRMFHRLYGLPVSIARVFMVYGPAQRDSSKLVPHAIERLRHGPDLTIGNGERLIDWIYVDDVISGLLAMTEAEGVDGESVDLGSGQLISTRDFVRRIASLMNSSVELKFGAVSDRPHEPIRKANVEASFAKIGWRPGVELTEGLSRTIEWYEDRLRKRA
jgi:UDP-glucose 4-epimerase